MTDPGRVVVAGDWHGNTSWAVHVIGQAATLLAGEPVKRILHCGDFGIWPGPAGVEYMNAVIGACFTHDIRLWFVDGNHEDFTQLAGWQIDGHDGKVVAWLPRGHRWAWHGRTWLACGGAVSPDRVARIEGKDWWPQEEITAGQEAAISGGGPADVMITHDCPAGVVHSYPGRPSWWDPVDIARSEQHQRRLQRIVDAVQPGYLVHGHLHRLYQRTCGFGYGPVEVTGLDADGTAGNYALLDVKAMTWGRPGYHGG